MFHEVSRNSYSIAANFGEDTDGFNKPKIIGLDQSFLKTPASPAPLHWRQATIDMNDYSKFLKEAEAMNRKYASIYFNCELESLAMPFWTWEEIQDGLSLRQEWEVDVSLTPFYGDWHNLFCLKESTGEIIALNDDREVLCTWTSIKDFKSCLSEKTIEYDDRPQTDSASHSPDQFEKSNGLKRKH